MSERKLTVSRVRQPQSKSWRKDVATIRLTGRWLEKLGFAIGAPVFVRESLGKVELVANWKWEMDEEQRVAEEDIRALREERLALEREIEMDEDEVERPAIGEA